jgi:hypothetical protein
VTLVGKCRGHSTLKMKRTSVQADGCPDVGVGISKADTGVRLLLGLFEFLDYGGNDFEEIADDSVIGDFEDGRVLVLVDGGDGA